MGDVYFKLVDKRRTPKILHFLFLL